MFYLLRKVFPNMRIAVNETDCFPALVIKSAWPLVNPESREPSENSEANLNNSEPLRTDNENQVQ